MKVWSSPLPFSSVQALLQWWMSVPLSRQRYRAVTHPAVMSLYRPAAKCSFSPLCHHSYNTSVVIATDKLFDYYTLFMAVWTIGQLCTMHFLILPLGCIRLFTPVLGDNSFYHSSILCVHVCATYLCSKQIISNIFKMIPFQVSSSPQTFTLFFPLRNSSQGAIFHSHSIRLGESHTALL